MGTVAQWAARLSSEDDQAGVGELGKRQLNLRVDQLVYQAVELMAQRFGPSTSGFAADLLAEAVWEAWDAVGMEQRYPEALRVEMLLERRAGGSPVVDAGEGA
jgi:hypothetical protein